MSRRTRNVPGNAEGNHARRRRSVARPLMKRTIVSRTGEARPPTTRYRVMTLFPANASMIEATANATPQRDTRLHGLHASKSERCSARIKPDRTTEMREVAPNRWAERPGQDLNLRGVTHRFSRPAPYRTRRPGQRFILRPKTRIRVPETALPRERLSPESFSMAQCM